MTDSPDYGALLKKALREIQSLKSALADAKTTHREPVAIIGMGCRFPGARDPGAFWQLLKSGSDAITEVPRSRWDVDAFYDADPDAPGKMYTRYGGFLDGIDQFDAQFFGVSPLDAANMDPQQRLLLEVAWEALEHAGQIPGAVPRTGVYVGSFMDDYLQQNFHGGDAREIDAYNTLGLLRGLAAGRLAYALDLHGPAMQLDTACSSSLLAAHLAVQGLRNRECDLALAGGVNLILAPEVTIGLCRMKAMAADGRCKAFDARADGYVRGEGCGIVVLKRLADALADGDAIYAVIRGSAVNHDGRSNGLTAPNGTAQKLVIRDALADAGVAPEQIAFVEAHGTGTSLGDPIEAIAIGEVLCQDRSERLLAGSVKSNFGHLESAAGAAALIKAALALHHRALPPSLHFEQPNPHIPWERLPIDVPVALTPLGEARFGGVSSFGMSGTNVHVIVERAPERPQVAADEGPYTLTISAASATALDELREKYIAFLETTDAAARDICHTSNRGRRHYEHRIAVVGDSASSLAAQLRARRPAEADSRARLYELGVDIEWPPCGSMTALPTYPFQRQRYWIEPRSRRTVSHGAPVPFSNELLYELPLRESDFRDHKLDGAVIVPAAFYLAKALEHGASLRDVVFPRKLAIEGESMLHLLASPSRFRFATREGSEWTTHAEGAFGGEPEADRCDFGALQSRFGPERERAADAGFDIGPSFRWTKGVRDGAREVLCRMDAANGSLAPGLIDACLRSLALTHDGAQRYAPFRIGALRVHGKPQGTLWCHAQAIDVTPQHLTGNIRLLDERGTIFLAVDGLEARAVTPRQPTFVVEWTVSTEPGQPHGRIVVCDTPEQLLAIVKEHHAAGTRADVTLITRNAQPVLPMDPIDPAWAWVTGFSRAVAMEFPQWRWTHVDSDSGEIPPLPAGGELAVRGGRVYVPAVVRREVDAEPRPFRAAATYLITGAFGAIGNRVARWMVANGARKLVLVGRNVPASVADLDADVTIAAADLADRDAVARLFDRPIDGIIHAAGVVDDAILPDLTASHFERVFAPKVRGTWNLHEQSLGRELEFFVCFSSAASLLGSKGQAHYAAANSYVDALMHHRRALGLPGLAINWGPWAGGGMAAGVEDRMRALGFDLIDPEQGLELLGRLIRSDLAQVGVIPGTWWSRNAAPKSDERFIDRLGKIPPESRKEQLEEHIRELIVSTMGKNPFASAEPDVSFFELGMDSLMSLDLRNRLEGELDRTLPSTIAFDYPTVAELAEHLLRG